MHNHLCPGWRGKTQTHGCVNQAPNMAPHLIQDEDQLLEVHDKTQPEVIMETEVASVGWLTGWRIPEHGKFPRCKDT